MPRYNIALTPITKADEVVKCANRLSALADNLKRMVFERSTKVGNTNSVE